MSQINHSSPRRNIQRHRQKGIAKIGIRIRASRMKPPLIPLIVRNYHFPIGMILFSAKPVKKDSIKTLGTTGANLSVFNASKERYPKVGIVRNALFRMIRPLTYALPVISAQNRLPTHINHWPEWGPRLGFATGALQRILQKIVYVRRVNIQPSRCRNIAGTIPVKIRIRCGACGNEGHNRSNATKVCCPAFYDEHEVDRRERIRKKKEDAIDQEHQRIKRLEREGEAAETLHRDRLEQTEKLKKNVANAGEYRKQELKRAKEKMQRMQKRKK